MQQDLIFSFAEWMCEFSRTDMADMLSNALLIAAFITIPLYLLSVFLYEKIMENIEKKKKRKSIIDRITKNNCLKEE